MQRQDFAKGNVATSILRIAIPLTVAQIINVLYSIVDRIYIGHIPGASALALAGVGLTAPIIAIVSAFSSLFGTGGTLLFAITRGKGDEKEAGRILGNSFFLLVLSGIVLTIGLLLFRRPVLFLFGASADTIPYADGYLSWYLLGTVPVMVGLGMNGFINAQGYPKIGMATVAIGALANIALDPLFIFVLGMGVPGAALATVISQVLSALWVLRFLTRVDNRYRLARDIVRPCGRLVRRITTLGLSAFIMQITNGLVSIACNISLARWGGDLYISVMTVLNSIRDVLLLGVHGVSSGAQPFLGYNYGAGIYSRVRKGIQFITVFCVAFSFVAWLVLFLFPEPFIRLFSQSPALIEAAVPAFRINFFAIFMMAFHITGQVAFQALGFSRQAIFFSLLRKAVIVAPLALLLPSLFGLGYNGVFMAEPISNIVSGVACYATMLRIVWPSLKQPDREIRAT